jgi:hypothetical protein
MAKSKAVATLPIDQEELAQVVEEGKGILQVIKGPSFPIIKTMPVYEQANELVRKVIAHRKGIKDFFEPMRKAADDLKKTILKQRDSLDIPFEQLESSIRSRMQEFNQEEERKANEKFRLLEEKAQAIRDAEIAKLKADGDKKAAAALKEAPLEVKQVENRADRSDTKYRISYEITLLDMEKVEDDFKKLILDEDAIKAAAKAGKALDSFKGLQVKEIKKPVIY